MWIREAERSLRELRTAFERAAPKARQEISARVASLSADLLRELVC